MCGRVRIRAKLMAIVILIFVICTHVCTLAGGNNLLFHQLSVTIAVPQILQREVLYFGECEVAVSSVPDCPPQCGDCAAFTWARCFLGSYVDM